MALKNITLITITAFLFLSACTDPDQAANKKVVEASVLKTELENTTDPIKRVIIQDKIIAIINSIITDHPSSNMAVKIANEENVAGINLKLLSAINATQKLNIMNDTYCGFSNFRSYYQEECLALAEKVHFDAMVKLDKHMAENYEKSYDPSKKKPYQIPDNIKQSINKILEMPIENWPKGETDKPIGNHPLSSVSFSIQ